MCVCTGIDRLTIYGKPTDIAYTNRIGIMPLAVRTDFLHRTSFFDLSGLVNDIVVANSLPT